MSSDSTASSDQRLAELSGIVRSCGECGLAATRTNAVPGEGSPTAKVMFIGEAPGADEDRLGRPFVGAAGQLLNELLQSIDLAREDVYITNIVKCRPPGNRVPTIDEVGACRDYLKVQVRIISPAVVATLGGPALRAVTGETRPMAQVHAIPIRMRYFTVFPLYHPAAALHDPSRREVLFHDMQLLRAHLRGES